MCKGKRTALLELLMARFPGIPRERLLSWVLCGEVYVSGERVRDPKRRVSAAAEVERRTDRYVSRAGEKLEAALDRFDVLVSGKTFLDVGAATGGFTDCLLQYGAAYVHTVDVAQNMLAYSVRTDSRVGVHEGTNVRRLPELEPGPDAVVCDLSFRSLRGVAGSLVQLAREDWGLFLVKPQFEREHPSRYSDAGHGEASRVAPEAEAGLGTREGAEPSFRGVVESAEEAVAIVRELLQDLQAEGAHAHALMLSPVRGRKGNREFLALLRGHPGPDVADLFSEAGLDLGRDKGGSG